MAMAFLKSLFFSWSNLSISELAVGLWQTLDEIEEYARLGVHALLVRETILDDADQTARLMSILNQFRSGLD